MLSLGSTNSGLDLGISHSLQINSSPTYQLAPTASPPSSPIPPGLGRRFRLLSVCLDFTLWYMNEVQYLLGV
ncbi:hypothetical protein L2E82_16994 [Cichorium intybus]|uniref:Uncharacterized protein n=1 Tax=Cichorium intybus TaxID=13427 RepID=A0ACB9F7L3_CICIN|nr:hypothetical protein L2E82_16994 [Cichorium intybus]